MESSKSFVDALDHAGYRLTQPRRQLASLVAEQRGNFTPAELEEEVRGRHVAVGRATIFRALELFVELGLVERLDLPSGEHVYVTCQPAHHHHILCVACGKSVEVEDCGVSAVAREIGRRTGFAIQSHRLQLYALCPDCQKLRAG
jgi:Fur family transcriptional regulator, ferric uptake regulator